MKHITNAPTPEALEALQYFSKKHPTWGAIHSAICAGNVEVIARYNSLMDSLVNEQAGICCYCEREVSDLTGGRHIEHIRPQSRYTELRFNYGNLGCSCNGRAGVDRHCGHLKGATFDEALFIPPHDSSIEDLLAYTPEGGVDAMDSTREAIAEHMINELGLRCVRLEGMRRGHGKGLVSTIDGFMEYEDAAEYIREFSRDYLEPREDGSIHAFFSLSRQIFLPRLTPAVAEDVN